MDCSPTILVIHRGCQDASIIFGKDKGLPVFSCHETSNNSSNNNSSSSSSNSNGSSNSIDIIPWFAIGAFTANY